MTRSAPGRLVRVRGRRLHVRDLGRGEPVVVLEAGAGGWSNHWGAVTERIAAETRVLAYDRAGLGWSDAAPPPRPASRLVDDLFRLLDELGVRSPAVLVGHSFGGAIVRLAAQRAPARVAGVVFVDAWHEAMAVWERDRGVDAAAPAWMLRAQVWAARLGLLRLLAALLPTPAPPWPLSPRSWREIIELSASARCARASWLEYQAAATSDREVAAVAGIAAPVRVLVARRTVNADDAPPGYPVDEHNRAWLEISERLAALSPDGARTILDETDHMIPLRRPEAVAAQVLELVAQVRRRS